jgi:hypothetical protein
VSLGPLSLAQCLAVPADLAGHPVLLRCGDKLGVTALEGLELVHQVLLGILSSAGLSG